MMTGIALGALVAVIGLAVPAASASTAAGAGNGVAAINPEPATAVEAVPAVSPARVCQENGVTEVGGISGWW